MSDQKLVRLFPTPDATVPGVPAVVMEVTPSQARKLLSFTPPAFTDTQPADDAHLEQFRDAGGHFVSEDFTERIKDLLPPPERPAPQPEGPAPRPLDPTKEPI